MSTAIGTTPRPSQPTWHVLYQAALFETDRNKVPDRIIEAERAIRNRVKELFVIPSDHIDEDLVLEDALYALHALRGCISRYAVAA